MAHYKHPQMVLPGGTMLAEELLPVAFRQCLQRLLRITHHDDSALIKQGQGIAHRTTGYRITALEFREVAGVHRSLDTGETHPGQGVEQIMPVVLARTDFAVVVNVFFVSHGWQLSSRDKTDGLAS